MKSSNTPFKNTLSGFSVIACVGLFCLGLAGFLFYDAWNVQGRPQQAVGTIVRINSGLGVKKGRGYAPEVTFTTADGRVVTFTNPVYSSEFRKKAGEIIPVYYSSEAPQGARVRMPVDSTAYLFIVIGGLLLFLGVWGNKKMKAGVEGFFG